MPNLIISKIVINLWVISEEVDIAYCAQGPPSSAGMRLTWHYYHQS